MGADLLSLGPLEDLLFLADLLFLGPLEDLLFLGPLEDLLFLGPLEALLSLVGLLLLVPLMAQLFLLQQQVLPPQPQGAPHQLRHRVEDDKLKGRQMSNLVYWLEYSNKFIT